MQEVLGLPTIVALYLGEVSSQQYVDVLRHEEK